MVKQRESYRPFAPVVTAEAARTYFEIPRTVANYNFMSFVVPVRPGRRKELGAVTHVDGTARLQIVNKDVDGRFYRLVAEFGDVTGTPVLLNTSFNGSAEPIVQDVDDVITCYLTTGIDYLVIEDFLVWRKAAFPWVDNLIIRFRPMTRLAERHTRGGKAAGSVAHEIYLDYQNGPRTDVSPEMYELLRRVDKDIPVGALVANLTDALRAELYKLWQARLIHMTPEVPNAG